MDENVSYRLKLAVGQHNNPTARAYLRSVAAEDILFWINTFVFAYDPRRTDCASIPFITYKYEDDLILDLVDRVQNQKDLLIDKSRDMGVTWCVLLVFVWFWQFKGRGFDFLLGSRKEQYIDEMGNMDTLFEKVRFILRNQGTFLLPEKFDWKNHSNYMKVINPKTGSTISGEATNNNFSRGGRRRGIFFDEFAFWETDKAAWRASADSTNCRIVVSTPYGFNNYFAELRHSGTIDVKSLHWTLHPEKDQKWYERECQRRNNDTVAIAQELDINYEGSAEGIMFEYAAMKKAVSNTPMMSQDRVVISLDPSGEGDDEAVFYVCNNGNFIERKVLNKTNDAELAAEGLQLINKYKAQVFICDAIGNGVITALTYLLGNNKTGVKIIAFDSRLKALNPVKYFNRRDEVYHQASEQLRSGNVQMDDDHVLMKQLNATRYFKDNDRIYISSKEDVKEQCSSSPDRADSWVLAVEGLRFTHSRREVEQKERYRRVLAPSGVESGHEYGEWGDEL